MSMYEQFYIIKNNRIKLLSVVSVGMVALTFLFISSTVTSAFASPFTAMSNQTLTQNGAGVIILEGATVIDGTGDLPKSNATIVINGNKIAYLSSDIATTTTLIPLQPKMSLI